MKSILVSILIGLLLIGTTGCEDTTIVKYVEPEEEIIYTEYTITDTVVGISDVLNPQEGDLKQLQIEDLGFEIIITTDTHIQVMRGSGSGYSDASVNNICIGHVIECKYYYEDTDYTISPVIIRANSIRAR